MPSDEWVAESPFSCFNASGEPVHEWAVVRGTDVDVVPAETSLGIDDMRDAFRWSDAPPVSGVAIRLCGDFDIAGMGAVVGE